MSFYADVGKPILEDRVIACVVLRDEALKSSARSGLCCAGNVMSIVLSPIGASEGLCGIGAVASLGKCHCERSGSDHPGCPEGQRGCSGLMAHLKEREAPRNLGRIEPKGQSVKCVAAAWSRYCPPHSL